MGKVITVSMKDVALAAGVCQATVSLALRRHASIPVTTCRRIERVAKKLGYQKNAPISTLMARVRSSTASPVNISLAAITGWPTRQWFRDSDFYQAIMKGATTRARDLGYCLEEFWLNEPGLTEKRISQIIEARGIDGAIVFPVPEHPQVNIDWKQLAGATIGYTLTSPLLPRVAVAHHDSVVLALAALAERGYSRIGLVVDRVINDRVQRHWLASFCASQWGQRAFGRKAVLITNDEDPRAVVEWYKAYKPDAILCGGVFHLRQHLLSAGIRAPEDVGIIGLSNRFEVSGCTYIDELPEVVGAVAVDLVVGQIHRNQLGLRSHHRDVLISCELREGETCPRKSTGNAARTTPA